MRKILLAIAAITLFTPALASTSAMAQTPAPTAAVAAQDAAGTTPDATATTVKKTAQKKIATTAAKTTALKNCDPKKSKPCGKACIPLARTCHK